MKSKIFSLIMLLAACLVSIQVNAQLEVVTSGDVIVSKNLDVNENVVVGEDLTVNRCVDVGKRLYVSKNADFYMDISVAQDAKVSRNLSVQKDMAIGTASADSCIGLKIYKTSKQITNPQYGIKSYLKINSGMPTPPLYGIHSTVDAFSDHGMCTQYPVVGVYGYAMKSYNFPNVFAAGIAGMAHVYGGIAVYGGTSYGASLPSSMPSGCYAGYFNGTVKVNGTLFATDISLPSSMSQTENAQVITSSVTDNIHLLKPVAYTIKQDSAWIDDKDAKELRGTHYGLIAEDVQKVLPDIVYDRNGELSVNYIELIPLLIKEIQELSAEVEDLKKVIK